jgi:hypothetical protein
VCFLAPRDGSFGLKTGFTPPSVTWKRPSATVSIQKSFRPTTCLPFVSQKCCGLWQPTAGSCYSGASVATPLPQKGGKSRTRLDRADTAGGAPDRLKSSNFAERNQVPWPPTELCLSINLRVCWMPVADVSIQMERKTVSESLQAL